MKFFGGASEASAESFLTSEVGERKMEAEDIKLKPESGKLQIISLMFKVFLTGVN